jgi:hypothetical protein
MPGSPLVTGRASKQIQRLLRRHGGRPLRAPRSFLVGKDNTIAPDELTCAEQWGAELGRLAQSHTRT